MQKIFWGIFVIFALFVPVQGQETTEVTETTIGPLTITHDEAWYPFEGPGGSIVIAEFDPEQISETNPIADDATIVQMRLIGLNRVSGLPGEQRTPENLLGGLLAGSAASPPEELPEITVIDGENFSFARADVSNEEVSSYVYTTILSDATFAILTFSTNADAAVLETTEPDLIAMLDTIALDFEAPIPENTYDTLAQSVTETGLPALGNADAPITIMEISSFDCPHCRNFYANLLPELLPYVEAGDVYFVYVPIYGTGGIPNGDSAARAAVCVGEENFWAYHNALFSWQDFGGFAFAYERLQAGASAIGMNTEEFDACYSSDAINEVLTTARQVTYDALGEAWRTPTIMINGVVLDQLSKETLIEAIDSLLEQSQ